jgi:alkaline phosphatase D
LLKGKENSRQAFLEYRANPSFGEGNEGIYTSFRYGPVEVFLLDTRWFARTEPSPVDAKQTTLLGKRQWDWLLAGLRNSTAPFKLITCGMIWDDKESRESDDWGTYEYERAALFDFLGKEKIGGAVLIGGDIHCSRLLKYETRDRAGYDIHQFIVSPIHNRTIESLNVPHPNLVHGEAVPHVWLRLEVDSTTTPATLHAKWEQMDGRKMWDVRLRERDLQRS